MSKHWQPQRVLVAVDFDPTAPAVLAQASAWAARLGAALVVLHVRTDESASESQLEAASRGLRTLVEGAISGEGPRRDLMVMPGRPGPVISDAAASMAVDLIVLGSHGRGTVGRWVLGSVAAEVLRRADIPVLVVKAPASAIDRGSFVAAVDFSAASEAATRYAGQLAADFAAPLCLLHVLPIGEHRSPGHAVMRETATRSLQELQARGVPATVETSVHVAMHMEAIGTAIAHYAEHQRARLIVMGGHGTSGWTRGMLGSVTERVLHESNRPVLVVRQAPSAAL